MESAAEGKGCKKVKEVGKASVEEDKDDGQTLPLEGKAKMQSEDPKPIVDCVDDRGAQKKHQSEDMKSKEN